MRTPEQVEACLQSIYDMSHKRAYANDPRNLFSQCWLTYNLVGMTSNPLVFFLVRFDMNGAVSLCDKDRVMLEAALLDENVTLHLSNRVISSDYPSNPWNNDTYRYVRYG